MGFQLTLSIRQSVYNLLFFKAQVNISKLHICSESYEIKNSRKKTTPGFNQRSFEVIRVVDGNKKGQYS